jgi:hypothetical protein
MSFDLKKVKLYEYIDVDESDVRGLLKEEGCSIVLVSDDFLEDGFINIVLSAPLGKVWTFFPFLRFKSYVLDKIVSSGRYEEKERRFLGYLRKHGVVRTRIKTNLFDLFDFSSEDYLGVHGEYWSITVPVDLADDFLSWLEDSLPGLLQFCGDVKDASEQDWKVGYFSEYGDWSPMWCMFKGDQERETFRNIYGDVKYPTPRLGRQMVDLTRGLDGVERVFLSLDRNKFLAKNSFRQSVVAFPYCDDDFGEDNEAPIGLIERRIGLINKFNIPHFYGSIELGAWAGRLSAREQLVYMISSNKGAYLIERLKNALSELDVYSRRMQMDYCELLVFPMK